VTVEPTAGEGDSNMTVRTAYTVEGMTCGHCVQAVTAALTMVPGVHGVEVELSTGEVTVDSDGTVPLDAIRAAVDEAGYALAGTHA
jgi:copper chaperone CopZ